MHLFFSGIGGAGIGPLAEIAVQAGYTVSGSDKQTTSYITALEKMGIKDIHIGQSYADIAAIHAREPIDWYVYSSAVTLEQADPTEIRFCREHNIKVSKRDELINTITREKGLKMVAVAGTHGKTTTTAMIVWLLLNLKMPISYLLPAKTSFGHMGQYLPDSRYFVIEADEFDRNFLHFQPWISTITGVSWDHHEIFPTREEYQQAFLDFIRQSQSTIIWQEDAKYLNLDRADTIVCNPDEPRLSAISLKGLFNRRDAWLAIQTVLGIQKTSMDDLLTIINRFPGLSRRMEEIAPNLFSDYAHTPEKIRGVMSVAREMAEANRQPIVVIYEPLTDRRQHYILDNYQDCFDGAKQIYWLPSYLAREDPGLAVLPPAELIKHLSRPELAQPAAKNVALRQAIQRHLNQGDMVIGIAGGGGGSLDDWLRANFAKS